MKILKAIKVFVSEFLWFAKYFWFAKHNRSFFDAFKFAFISAKNALKYPCYGYIRFIAWIDWYNRALYTGFHYASTDNEDLKVKIMGYSQDLDSYDTRGIGVNYGIGAYVPKEFIYFKK